MIMHTLLVCHRLLPGMGGIITQKLFALMSTGYLSGAFQEVL